jgi:hypothetical protein
MRVLRHMIVGGLAAFGAVTLAQQLAGQPSSPFAGLPPTHVG